MNNINNFENLIVTTYFSNDKGNYKGRSVLNNNIDYISPWYNSILKLKLNGVIFHDGLSNDFINKYTTDKINFLYVDSEEFSYSKNDYRFLIYYNFLKYNKNIKNIFMTDGNDVIIKNNPFSYINDNNKKYNKNFYYVCSEFRRKLKDNNFTKFNFNRINKYIKNPNKKFKIETFEKNQDNILFNAGILGGNRNNMLYFLRLMKEKFNKTFRYIPKKFHDRNINMIVFNYVIYDIIGPENAITGHPLHSLFTRYEKRNDVIFSHK